MYSSSDNEDAIPGLSIIRSSIIEDPHHKGGIISACASNEATPLDRNEGHY
jgi:hypothetical protein